VLPSLPASEGSPVVAPPHPAMVASTPSMIVVRIPIGRAPPVPASDARSTPVRRDAVGRRLVPGRTSLPRAGTSRTRRGIPVHDLTRNSVSHHPPRELSC
jgi:hypothetical protein